VSEAGDAQAVIEAAAQTVEAVRVFPLGATLTPPAVVVGPPRLEWATSCPGPTTAFFTVFVVAALDDRALELLYELAPQVGAAIEAESAGVVLRADPGTYNAGTGDLPAYALTVEYPL
jgi:hypothetical protein